MALDAAVLSAAIEAAMLADGSIGAVKCAGLTGLCDAIAGAVVAHITSAAVVVPTALLAPPGGGSVTGVGGIT